MCVRPPSSALWTFSVQDPWSGLSSCVFGSTHSLTIFSVVAEIHKQGGGNFPVYLLSRSCLPAHHHRVPAQRLPGETPHIVMLLFFFFLNE